MTEIRGRYFGFLGLLCATWVAARLGFVVITPDMLAAPKQAGKSKSPAELQSAHYAAGRSDVEAPIRAVCCKPPLFVAAAPAKNAVRVHERAPKFGDVEVTPNMALLATASTGGQVFIAQPPAPPSDHLRRIQLYAYSFWRSGTQGASLGSGTQYGGSQSGFVATYALGRLPTKGREQRLALLLRGAIAHENMRERELAAGVRWKPLQNLPLTITGERRFRANRGDAFAAYVAGGLSDVALPYRFRLEGYGQAGVVSGKQAGPFFDFLARADRRVAQVGKAKIAAGAGLWGGGQKEASRFDIGPSVRTDIALGEANFRLSADWRFRIAGEAKPGNGPAVTLSTSF